MTKKYTVLKKKKCKKQKIRMGEWKRMMPKMFN